MTPTHKGQRWGLLSMPVDEEVESLHLRFLATPPNGNFADAVFRFNANISYSGVLHAVTQDGLFSENKEKLINNAITALLSQEGDVVASNAELESQFQAVRRLVASKAGFLAFTQLPKFRERLGVKVVKALKRSNNGVIHAAVDMLCALMCPMHDDYDLRQEQLNKASLLSSKKFLENLLEKFNSHVDHGTGALVISSLLDFLTFALCAPYSETTEGQQFDMLLEMVASNGRTLFKLFQ
ncbi:dnaJ homolog subfamily C member 13-like, partial [Leptonychotes weddellii]|uniref:DnaJ homolog subfamily C member 13-like n=3 Tax=Boreoeutheria TaxID=1437010 RepID=A0A7F8QDI4_LEPWE